MTDEEYDILTTLLASYFRSDVFDCPLSNNKHFFPDDVMLLIVLLISTNKTKLACLINDEYSSSNWKQQIYILCFIP